MALHLLIVDDSPAMRTFVKRVVKLSGFTVDQYLEAGNGVEALQVASANSVDAILTDINMPVMDGEQFLREMRHVPALQQTPVIVISTDSTSHRIETMMSLGANGYVHKPFGPEELRNELEKVLGHAA
jgi:two-component system chemotaxis response regulator CheY